MSSPPLSGAHKSWKDERSRQTRNDQARTCSGGKTLFEENTTLQICPFLLFEFYFSFLDYYRLL